MNQRYSEMAGALGSPSPVAGEFPAYGPNSQAPAGSGGTGLNDMTTGQFLNMLYAQQLARDPGNIGTDPVHNMLGGQHGFTQRKAPYALAEKQHGVNLGGPLNMDDVAKVQRLIGGGNNLAGQGRE